MEAAPTTPVLPQPHGWVNSGCILRIDQLMPCMDCGGVPEVSATCKHSSMDKSTTEKFFELLRLEDHFSSGPVVRGGEQQEGYKCASVSAPHATQAHFGTQPGLV